MPFDSLMRLCFVMRWLLRMTSAAALLGAARADTVLLRNGNTLEGIVTRETDAQIVLDMGIGSSTLPRNTVRSVERASEEANDRIRSDWKQKYFLHRQYVPAGLADLAAGFAKLGASREDALRAHRALTDLPAKESRLRAELDEVHAQIVETGRRIQATTAEQNVEAYNALITTNNSLQARWMEKTDELLGCRKERTATADRISAYQAATVAFTTQFVEQRKKLAPTEEAVTDRMRFFDRVTATLAEYARDFASAEVAATPSHGGVIVTARVNDQVQGSFIVDTGADRVTVTEAFAKRMNLDLTALPEAEFVMADGHRTKGRIVVFRVVAVGDARVTDVEAAVLSGKPGDQADGLLGMAFLKHFLVSFDGNNGKLTLRRFAPKP